MDWFKRDSGLIIKTGSGLESGSLLKGLAGASFEAALPLLPHDPCGVHEELRLPEDVHPDDPVGPISGRSAVAGPSREDRGADRGDLEERGVLVGPQDSEGDRGPRSGEGEGGGLNRIEKK